MVVPCVPAPITSNAIDSSVHTSRNGGLADRGKTEERVRSCLVFGPFGSDSASQRMARGWCCGASMHHHAVSGLPESSAEMSKPARKVLGHPCIRTQRSRPKSQEMTPGPRQVGSNLLGSRRASPCRLCGIHALHNAPAGAVLVVRGTGGRGAKCR